jgi:hypothetical protein
VSLHLLLILIQMCLLFFSFSTVLVSISSLILVVGSSHLHLLFASYAASNGFVSFISQSLNQYFITFSNTFSSLLAHISYFTRAPFTDVISNSVILTHILYILPSVLYHLWLCKKRV